MPTDFPNIIAGTDSTIQILAADAEKKGPREFESTFYTGGALSVEGWDLPVVVDLAGLTAGKVLVANLDHDPTKRVGNFEVANDGKTLVAKGKASAATPARDEVVGSASDGYQWQASLEVKPAKGSVELVKAEKTVTANGQTFTGPLYITRKGTLKGFAFVSHGADDNTSASIAAKAASNNEQSMEAGLKSFIEAALPNVDIDALQPEVLASLTASYEGKNGKKPAKAVKASGSLEGRKLEAERIEAIQEKAESFLDSRYRPTREEIQAVEDMTERAISSDWTVDRMGNELLMRFAPGSGGQIINAGDRGDDRVSQEIIEAAICLAGNLSNIEKHYDPKVLDAAHKHYRNGISLKQVWFESAKVNGFRPGYDVTPDVQAAAIGRNIPDRIIRGQAYSSAVLTQTLANTANKFMHEGFDAVDTTCMRIASIRPVKDFKQTTTIVLGGNDIFKKLGPDGQIQHGTIAETTYNNQAYTYARMLAITRQDLINDDLGVLVAAPRKLGRGGALKLNDIFWTAFLDNSAFFTSGHASVSTGAGSVLGLAGLSAAEVVFMNQTDPDGFPLGIDAAILLVPPTLKSTALTLMNSQIVVGGTTSASSVSSAQYAAGNANVFVGKYRVESSPYMENTSYTGYGTAVWYLLADPGVMPTIEIVALNGRVEPTVDTADTAFDTLGVQMRAYADFGVATQEYRGGVRSAGT